MNKKLSLALATGACVCAMTVPAMAADYIKGETPIFEGAAVGANDVTIYNDKIAVSFAVDTPNYWNMTGDAVMPNMINFYKNISISGAFLLLAIVGPGRISLDKR